MGPEIIRTRVFSPSEHWPGVFSFLTPGRANYRLPTVGGSNGKRSGDNLMSHFKRRSYFLLFMLLISLKYLFSQNDKFFFFSVNQSLWLVASGKRISASTCNESHTQWCFMEKGGDVEEITSWVTNRNESPVEKCTVFWAFNLKKY